MVNLLPKEGELRALEKIYESHTDSIENFIPNIILNEATTAVLDKLINKYPEKMLLDTRHLIAEDLSELEDILQSTTKYENFKIIYQIEDILNEESEIHADYIRIDKSVISPFFIGWLRTNSHQLPTNIIIDFGYIDSNLDEKTREVIEVINLLNDKNIFISSCAIPTKIPTKSDEDYQFSRFEVNLYDYISKQTNTENNLYFSDYATVPIEQGTFGRAVVQIKYTLQEDYWFVRNGMRVGNYDFVNVCDRIVADSPQFNQNYCWADSYIYEVTQIRENKGNPSIWVSLGVNRHIQVCIDEFS